jgi:hypothetical protein
MFEVIKTFGSTFLRGRLTYIVAGIGIVAAILMFAMGTIDQPTLIMLLNANLAILGIRRAIK